MLAKLLSVWARTNGVSCEAGSQGLLLSQCFHSWFWGFKLRAEAVASGCIVRIFWAVVVTLVLQHLHHLEDGLLFVSIHLSVLEMRPGSCISMTVGHLPHIVFDKSSHLSIALWWCHSGIMPLCIRCCFWGSLLWPRVLRSCLQRFLTSAARFASLNSNLLAEQGMEEVVLAAVSHAVWCPRSGVGSYFSSLSLTLVCIGWLFSLLSVPLLPGSGGF